VSDLVITREQFVAVSGEMEEIRYELDLIHAEIVSREDTFWEAAKKPLIRIIRKVASIISITPIGFINDIDIIRRITRD